MIETHPDLPIQRQCDLLSLPRSTFYYQAHSDNAYNEQLMRLIDEEYTLHPFIGSPRMTDWLRRTQGKMVNHKRVERLMRVMGIASVLPGPHTSRPHPEHKIYPYLLRSMEITQPNHVWCADITYIRLRTGFVYLVAVMDWASRFVLSWELSNTMDVSFCLAALEHALEKARPQIFNTDQGSQFTSLDWTKILNDKHILISMDGRRRVFDNIFIERLWRTLKYEEVYLHDYANMRGAWLGIRNYLTYYNNERPHSSLRNQTPFEAYHG